jgi:hypothetical protein
MPFEAPKPDLRASDADREATVERLRVAAIEGRLDADELDARLSAAYAARYLSELERLTLDVTPPAPAPPPAPPPFVAARRRTNGLAVASFVMALLWMGWFGSVLAVVLGHAALRQIARAGGREGGRGLAVAGLLLGYASIAAVVVAAIVRNVT